MGTSLKWEASWSADWITSVNGETGGKAEGIGDGRVPVVIVNGGGTPETSSTTITFKYYDAETGDEVGVKSIKVCRCICGCGELEFFPEPCGCNNFDVLEIIDVDTCNCEDLEFYNVDCKCDILTISPSTLNPWEWNKTDAKTITIDATNECVIIDSIVVKITGENEKHFSNTNPSFTNRIGSFTVYPNGRNEDTTNDLTATLLITYQSGNNTQCEIEIPLKHNKMVCDCNNFDVIEVKDENT